MSNPLFDAIIKEEAPMYDAAIITEKGTELWKNPVCHNANNSHSATKFFVATAIGQLYDKGLLSLDDKVTSFFTNEEMGDFCEGWNKVSVFDTLRHKTGIEHIPYGVDEDNDIEKIGEDFLKYVFSLKIEHEPGTFYHYSDASFYLLGRIIGKASGKHPVDYLRDNILSPLRFKQWAMALCPGGYPICGGGFFTRADDMAKLAFAYSCGGEYNGRRIISREWISLAMENDFACTRFRDTDIFLKTGARGQCVAFSTKHKAAAAWHGCSAPDDNGKRNDRLLLAFNEYLKTL